MRCGTYHSAPLRVSAGRDSFAACLQLKALKSILNTQLPYHSFSRSLSNFSVAFSMQSRLASLNSPISSITDCRIETAISPFGQGALAALSFPQAVSLEFSFPFFHDWQQDDTLRHLAAAMARLSNIAGSATNSRIISICSTLYRQPVGVAFAVSLFSFRTQAKLYLHAVGRVYCCCCS